MAWYETLSTSLKQLLILVISPLFMVRFARDLAHSNGLEKGFKTRGRTFRQVTGPLSYGLVPQVPRNYVSGSFSDGFQNAFQGSEAIFLASKFNIF